MLCAEFGWCPLILEKTIFEFRQCIFTKIRFGIISLWKKDGFFIWTKLITLYPKMICAKFGWNWPSVSGEDDFLNSSMYFRYFGIISPRKGAGPSFEPIWISLTQWRFVPGLVKMAQWLWRRRFFKFGGVFLQFRYSLQLENGGVLHLNRHWIRTTKRWFVQSLVKIGSLVLK